MASNQYLSRLGFILALDSSEFLADVEKAQREWKDFSNEAKRDSAAAAKAIIELEVATRNYGKTVTAVDRMQTEIQTGKYAKAMQWEKDLLLQKAKAYDAVAVSSAKANKAQGGMTAQQQAALGYQTTDIITSLAGGQNPMMVLLQQGGQLRDQFGGFRPLFAGIAAAITPVGVAVTAVGASVLGFGYALYKGNEEQKAFNNSLVLTNGYLNMTEAQFTGLSQVISSKYHTSLGDTREAMQAVASSGKFTATSFETVAEVIARMSKLTGDSASVTAQNLIPALDGSASSAARLNSQYHFLTLEQYKHIEALEKQGKKQEAIKETASLLLDSLKKQTNELNSLGKAWEKATESLEGYWQKFKNIAKEETPEESLQRLKNRISYLASGDQSVAVNRDALAGAQEQLRLIQKMKTVEDDLANAKAKRVEKDQAAIEFQQKYGQQLIDMSAKTAEETAKKDYAIAAKGLDEISQLTLKKKMEDALAVQELNRKIAANPQIAGKLRALAKEEAARKQAEIDLQQANISRDELNNYKKKALAEESSIEKEKERLEVYKNNLLASDADLQIALSRLKTEQEIAEIEKNKKLDADPTGKALEQDRLRNIQKAREAVINQAADLKMLQDMNQSVFNNMGSAIDNFVRTGKLSFKDLTRSIIQDLISIAMKAQMMAMFKGFNFFSAAAGSASKMTVATPGAGGYSTSGMEFADGGVPPVGMASLVGENGPELFVPHTAGTIIPNGQFGSSSSNAPSVNYNGPYIANMSAIDTQSGVQFLAKNKQAVWAVYQSANRSVPVTR